MHNPNPYVGTDEQLETPGREGTTQAWEQILSNGLPLLHRQAYRLLGNAADAEDAVQDALLAAYTHLDQFKGQSQISTWLTSIVLNCARMQLRRRSRYVHVPLDEPTGDIHTLSLSDQLPDQRPDPENEYRNSELGSSLAHFHRQLSPTLLRTFELHDVEGLSLRDTARILGIPAGTVKARSARARQKMKELMEHALRRRSRGLTEVSATSRRFSRRTHSLRSHHSSGRRFPDEIARNVNA